MADRKATQAEYFKRPDDPLRIVFVDARSGGGIDAGQLSMQVAPAMLIGLIHQACAQQGIGLGHVRQTIKQGAKIKPCATYQQRNAIRPRENVAMRPRPTRPTTIQAKIDQRRPATSAAAKARGSALPNHKARLLGEP